MQQNKTIDPGLAGGFRDYLPEDMIPRQKMFDTIRSVFECFGFLPLDTPGIEREEILTGGDPNFRMQIFKTGLREGDEGLALRFDLTVPLARVVSLYSDKLEKPFKRYQMGKVWRGEKPQAGRFREFIQFDADIVGSNRVSADAEIVALMYETLTALNIGQFRIRINNRKILNGLSSFAGYDQALNADVLRSIDKLDKIRWEGVSEELAQKGLTPVQIGKLEQFINLKGESAREIIANLLVLMSESPEAIKGIGELQEIANCLDSLSIPAECWNIDLSVARGLGYYTGPVFETILSDLPSIGSVFSGGRYDDLVSRFGNQNLPSTGASVGVDRLFAAMEKLSLLKKEKTIVKATILNFDKDAEDYCQMIVTSLRKKDIASEIYLGKEAMLKGQLSYAIRQEIPVVIIAGGKEKEKKTAQVKDMRKRIQTEVPFDQITSAVETILTS
ncbi:MAG: histidine--tRNA ligase [Patescibacteria group bacterium]